MKGLPRVEDTTPPNDAWDVFVCGGIEKLTYALRRGKSFTPKSVQDMQKLQRRLNAFSDALDARIMESKHNDG